MSSFGAAPDGGAAWRLTWSLPASHTPSTSDFLAVVSLDDASEGSYVTYHYSPGTPSGTFRFDLADYRSSLESKKFVFRYYSAYSKTVLETGALQWQAGGASEAATAEDGHKEFGAALAGDGLWVLSWTLPSSHSASTSDFIAVVAHGESEGSYETYHYAPGTSTGSFRFDITNYRSTFSSGKFVFRYYSAYSKTVLETGALQWSGDGATAASASSAAAEATTEATLTASRSGDGVWELSWTLPASYAPTTSDFIAVVAKGESDGAYETYHYVPCAGWCGSFRFDVSNYRSTFENTDFVFRYYSASSKTVVESSALNWSGAASGEAGMTREAKPVKAPSLKVASRTGNTFEVAFDLGSQVEHEAGNFIALCKCGAGETEYLTYGYPRGQNGVQTIDASSVLAAAAPRAEFRYYSSSSKVLFSSQPFDISIPAAPVQRAPHAVNSEAAAASPLSHASRPAAATGGRSGRGGAGSGVQRGSGRGTRARGVGRGRGRGRGAAAASPGGETQPVPPRPAQKPAATPALPAGWEMKHTAEGRAYYVNHTTKTTQWHPPSASTVTTPAARAPAAAAGGKASSTSSVSSQSAATGGAQSPSGKTKKKKGGFGKGLRNFTHLAKATASMATGVDVTSIGSKPHTKEESPFYIGEVMDPEGDFMSRTAEYTRGGLCFPGVGLLGGGGKPHVFKWPVQPRPAVREDIDAWDESFLADLPDHPIMWGHRQLIQRQVELQEAWVADWSIRRGCESGEIEDYTHYKHHKQRFALDQGWLDNFGKLEPYHPYSFDGGYHAHLSRTPRPNANTSALRVGMVVEAIEPYQASVNVGKPSVLGYRLAEICDIQGDEVRLHFLQRNHELFDDRKDLWVPYDWEYMGPVGSTQRLGCTADGEGYNLALPEFDFRLNQSSVQNVSFYDSSSDYKKHYYLYAFIFRHINRKPVPRGFFGRNSFASLPRTKEQMLSRARKHRTEERPYRLDEDYRSVTKARSAESMGMTSSQWEKQLNKWDCMAKAVLLSDVPGGDVDALAQGRRWEQRGNLICFAYELPSCFLPDREEYRSRGDFATPTMKYLPRSCASSSSSSSSSASSSSSSKKSSSGSDKNATSGSQWKAAKLCSGSCESKHKGKCYKCKGYIPSAGAFNVRLCNQGCSSKQRECLECGKRSGLSVVPKVCDRCLGYAPAHEIRCFLCDRRV